MVQAVMVAKRRGSTPPGAVDGMKMFEGWTDQLARGKPPKPVKTTVKRRGAK